MGEIRQEAHGSGREDEDWMSRFGSASFRKNRFERISIHIIYARTCVCVREAEPIELLNLFARLRKVDKVAMTFFPLQVAFIPMYYTETSFLQSAFCILLLASFFNTKNILISLRLLIFAI